MSGNNSRLAIQSQDHHNCGLGIQSGSDIVEESIRSVKGLARTAFSDYRLSTSKVVFGVAPIVEYSAHSRFLDCMFRVFSISCCAVEGKSAHVFGENCACTRL